jgi:hypothetical protein
MSSRFCARNLFAKARHARCSFGTCLSEPSDRRRSVTPPIENNLLSSHKLIANVRHLCCNVVRDRGDTITRIFRAGSELLNILLAGNRERQKEWQTSYVICERAILSRQHLTASIQGSLTVSQDRLAF